MEEGEDFTKMNFKGSNLKMALRSTQNIKWDAPSTKKDALAFSEKMGWDTKHAKSKAGERLTAEQSCVTGLMTRVGKASVEKHLKGMMRDMRKQMKLVVE